MTDNQGQEKLLGIEQVQIDIQGDGPTEDKKDAKTAQEKAKSKSIAKGKSAKGKSEKSGCCCTIF